MENKARNNKTSKDSFWAISSFGKSFFIRGFEVILLSITLSLAYLYFPDWNFLIVITVGILVITAVSFTVYKTFLGEKPMSEHLHLPQIDNNDPPLPNQPFFSWLRTQNTLFISQILAIISFVSTIAASIYYVLNVGHEQDFINLKSIKLFIDFAHIFIITIFIGSLYKILDKNEQGSYRVSIVYERVFKKHLHGSQLKKGKKQLKKFKLSFLFFWFSMLVLYILFAIHHAQEKKGDANLESTYTKIQEASNLSLTIDRTHEGEKAKIQNEIFDKVEAAEHPRDEINSSRKELNQVEIAFPTQEAKIKEIAENLKEANDSINKTKHVADNSYAAVKLKLFEFLTFALNNISLMFIFWCFSVLCFPSFDRKSIRNQRMFKNFSFLFVLLITSSFPLLIFLAKSDEGFTQSDLTAYITIFDAISGTLNAVVVALLIARLDSKLIGLHTILVSILYVYSAVQPLFVAFEQPGQVFQIIMTFVLIFVFIFKIYFFFIITYTLQTGRLLNYLICFPTLARRVDSIFANQFEIEIHKEEKAFNFSIKKKNIPIYKSDNLFESRESCLEQIEELRELMKTESSYKGRDSCGTYWLEIVSSKENKICHSIDLKSKNEIEDLKHESMEKIPYCKLKRS